MAGVIEIALSGLRFFSNHGLYAEEAVVGSEFEVNIIIGHAVGDAALDQIEDTIDYVAVYEIAKDHIGTRSELLETTAMKMAATLKLRFAKIKNIRLTIKKLAPPITNFIGDVSVTYESVY